MTDRPTTGPQHAATVPAALLAVMHACFRPADPATGASAGRAL